MDRSAAISEKIIRETEAPKAKGMKTLVMLVLWEVWLERNQSTFRGNIASVHDVVAAIRRNIQLWRHAGASCLELPFAEPPACIG